MKRTGLYRKTALLILGTLLFKFSFCQENYLEGYIVSLEGDTLKGFIDYRNPALNPEKIDFKQNINSDHAEYKPLEIKEFGVADEIYVSAAVETEISTDKSNTLKTISELQIKKEDVFLQTIIKGKKSLYYYKNKDSKMNLYIKRDSLYDLLIYKRYYKEEDMSIRYNRKYSGQLLYYLKDCSSLKSLIYNVKYKKESIEKIFIKYYKCLNSDLTFVKKTEKSTVEIGAIAGMTITSLKFIGDDMFDYLINSTYPNSFNFSGGCYFDIILSRNLKKWSLNNELFFTSFKTGGYNEDITDADRYTLSTSKIGFSYINMNNMLRYSHHIGSSSIFFNGGISSGVVIKTKNSLKKETRFYTTERTTIEKALKEVRSLEFGFLLGIGVKYKKISFEFRYERGNGFSKYPALGSKVNRYHFLLGYQFN